MPRHASSPLSSDVSSPNSEPDARRLIGRSWFPFAFIAVLSIGVAFFVSPRAAVLVLYDGFLAGVVLAVVSLAGTWITAVGDWKPVPLRWHLLAGAVVGVGGTAATVLLLGSLGLMYRTLWIAILALLAGLGVRRLAILLRARQPHKEESTLAPRLRWFWLLVTPFLVIAILAATTPPGILWVEEANGYDVLEYHLGVPKEYYDAGRIQFLPHNVYSNFPFNAEMFSLLAMILWQSPYEAVFTAKLFNVGFGILAVFAAWCLGRDLHPAAGPIAGLLAATCPWLCYLCGVAFVENGLLFMSTASVAFAVRCLRSESATSALGDAVPAGLAAGFAAGFKYTALPMLALPIGVVLLLDTIRRPSRSWRGPVLFAFTAIAAMSPWLIKNLAATGNPVFPLAHHIFPSDENIWPDSLVQRWDRGHQPVADQDPLSARIRLLWKRVLADGRIGPALFLLALPAAISIRSSPLNRYLLGILIFQLLVWMFATHLYARFAVLVIPTLLALCVRTVAAAGRLRPAILPALLLGSAANLYEIATLYYHHAFFDGRPAAIHLATEMFRKGLIPGTEYVGAINDRLGPDDKVLLLAEARHFYIDRPVAYAVVFSPDAFLDAVDHGASPADLVRWLRDNELTHLYVGWSEVARLSRTYGYSKRIRPLLLAEMEAAGLKSIETFRGAPNDPPYGQLYEVKPK